MVKVNELFSQVASKTTHFAGSHFAFLGASISIIIWLGFGPAYHWSDSYQLVANSGTTIITYLMVFLIQNTQNRENRIQQLKLDAILCALKDADHRLVGSEDLSESDLAEIDQFYRDIAERIRDKIDLNK
jgi:low affinity Fe/Cu permease